MSMKLNIFLIPINNIQELKNKFAEVNLHLIHNEVQEEWSASFYFSRNKEPNQIPWIKTFAHIFKDREYKNLMYYGAYIFEKNDRCFVLSFGKRVHRANEYLSLCKL